EDELCLAGFSPRPRHATKDLQSVILHNYFCYPGDTRTHAYVTAGRDGQLWLAKILFSPVGSEQEVVTVAVKPRNSILQLLRDGYAFEKLGDEKLLLLSTETYEKPDLSLTLRHGLNAAVVFGYQNLDNYTAFRISGPLVYGKYIRNRKMSPPMQLNAIPRVKPEYRIEVRHGGPYVFFFVDDYLLTYLYAELETKGKVGIALQKTSAGETSFGDFLAAPSVRSGSPVFKPIIQIPD
ncbi:MAG: hypothetical protein ACYSR5_10400, partial [Planctomycetota bacterium]